MKTLFTALTSALFMTLTVSAAEFIEIDTPILENTVQKIYSVYCPFCYKYEKAVTPKLIAALPDYVTFQPICLENKGELGIESCEVLAAVDIIDHEKYKKAKLAMYAAIHDKKIDIVRGYSAEKGALAKIGLDAAGVSQAEFAVALATDNAQAKLAYDRTIAISIAKIKGIPAIVVNGNQLVDSKSVKSMKDLFDTVVKAAK